MSKSSESVSLANIPPRQPIEEPVINPPAYSPSPSSIPQPLPLWTTKYDGVCQPDPEIVIAGASYQSSRPDAVIRVDSANKKDPPRDVIFPLLPNDSSIADILSNIVTLASALPPTCYLWELIRRESDQNFSVKVFVQGEWRRVTLSGCLLADSDGHVVWPCTSNPNELWPGLLAKAAAVVSYVPAFTLFTGFALVDYQDFSTILSGFFSKPIAELSPNRRLYNLANLKPTCTSAYTDLTKPFRNNTEILINVPTQAPQLVLISLDPARTSDGRSRAESQIKRFQSWTSTTDIVKIVTDSPYHQLLLLSPGIYQISTSSLCGVVISIRSESEAVTLDAEGHAWTRDPFHLHVSSLAGKHVGAPGPHLFTIFFQIAIGLESAASILPIISFDDNRLEFTAELAIDSDEPVRVVSGSLVEHVAPGSYILRAFARSGSEYGISPGAFSVRLLSDHALSCSLLSHSNVARSFSDTFRCASRDLRVFREILTSTCKETIIVSIDVHLDPADVKFACRIDNGTALLGVGCLAVPMVKIAPGQKVTIDCRLDYERPWTSWRMRVCPGEIVQIVPSTDRRDKLEALKKQWGNSDPGRHERGIQSRQVFLNRDRSHDAFPTRSANCTPEQINNIQEVTVAAASVRSNYISVLANEISSTTLFTDQQFQKYKSIIEDQVSERDRYRSKIQQYEALLSSLNEAIEEGDANLVLSQIELAKIVPSWKVGRSIYQAYVACFGIHNNAIKQAIDDEDINGIFDAVKAAEILDSLPIIEAPIYTETVTTRTKAVSVVANEAIKPLNDIMSQSESRDRNSVHELIIDDHFNEIRQFKLLPDEFQQSIQRAQEWLDSQSPNPPA